MEDVSKADWKLFMAKIGGWQESYMDRLNHEYIELLSSDQPASVKFWALDRKMKEDKKKPGVQLVLQKSNTYWDIARLIHDGVITMDDLDEFSNGLREAVQLILERWCL